MAQDQHITNRFSFMEKDWFKRSLRWGSRIVTVAIAGYLFYRLRQIGWDALRGALPTNPWFYALFVVIYLTQPLADLLVYRQVWRLPIVDGMRALLKKRVFNEEMAGYSGEVYLYWWLSQQSHISRTEAFRVVRDNNILSSVASMTVAFGLVAILGSTGYLELDKLAGRASVLYVAVAIFAAIALTTVAYRFRHHFFSLQKSTARKILGIHFGRLLVANLLLAVQWSVGAPGISISVWLTYLCIFIVMNRIPFLPSKDLFFLGASVELSGSLGVATTAVAGMLVASSVLVRSTNLIVFLLSQPPGRASRLKEAVIADDETVTERE